MSMVENSTWDLELVKEYTEYRKEKEEIFGS